MIEITPRLRHRHRARGLAHDDHGQSQRDERRLPARESEPGHIREEEVGEQAFEHGGGVRDVVGAPVLAEQEGGDGGEAGVVGCRGPVFEEVEEGERAEEEGDAPEGGGGGVEEEVEGEEESSAEGEAQEEGAEGDAGEGFGGLGEVGRVEGRCRLRSCGGGCGVLCVAVCGAVVVCGGRPCCLKKRCSGVEVEV